MITKHYRAFFSIINKIRNRERLKAPSSEKFLSKPYQYGDFIGTATFQQRKSDLTPFQQYLIETKSMERPYTGNLWGEKSTGFYHCAVCDTRLFTFSQKFLDDSGYACFLDCVQKRVTILEQQTNFELVNIFPDPFLQQQIKKHKRCECSICKSHIGALFFNGPFPTFLKFAINSHSLIFKQLEDFQDPNIKRRQRILQKRLSKRVFIK